jgi:hypothetical protein
LGALAIQSLLKKRIREVDDVGGDGLKDEALGGQGNEVMGKL